MNSSKPNRWEDHNPSFSTDLHDPQNPTWWQSETMYEGIQHPNHVNLTLHLRKSVVSEAGLSISSSCGSHDNGDVDTDQNF